jgi:hypothetical protein
MELLRLEYFRWKERKLETHAAFGQYQYDLIRANAAGDSQGVEAAIEKLVETARRLRKFHTTTD